MSKARQAHLLPRGVLCPACGLPSTRVINSRPEHGGQMRRHECLRCGGRFTTVERIRGFERGNGRTAGGQG